MKINNLFNNNIFVFRVFVFDLTYISIYKYHSLYTPKSPALGRILLFVLLQRINLILLTRSAPFDGQCPSAANSSSSRFLLSCMSLHSLVQVICSANDAITHPTHLRPDFLIALLDLILTWLWNFYVGLVIEVILYWRRKSILIFNQVWQVTYNSCYILFKNHNLFIIVIT